MIYDQLILIFKVHVALTVWSYRYALCNIRRIRPYLTEKSMQLLIQSLAISHINYCNSSVDDPECSSMFGL